MFRNNRAHIEVSNSHLARILLRLDILALVERVAEVLACNSLLVSLCRCHQRIQIGVDGAASKVDIWLHELVFETNLVLFLGFSIQIQSNKSFFGS